MKRNNTYLLFSIVPTTLFLSSCSTSQEKNETSEEFPNILWLSCEDISPHLGCYGDTLANTPNIDKLASQGIRYTNVFSSAPVCAPCRSGIITGMYQTTIGTHHMRTSHRSITGDLPTPYQAVPPHYVKGFPEYLRDAGYYCTNNRKTDYQFGEPFTIWDELSDTAHYKNRKDKDQPFFSVFNYVITHESHNWPDPEVTDPDDVPVPPYYPDTKEVRKDIARLYDNIAILDSIVGKMLRELEERGLAENTIVFFWSDHGDGLPRGKRWLYDSGTRVPLIIRWPGKIEPGSVSDRLISSIDFGPTVLSMAGIEVPAHMQGIPFSGEQTNPARQYVFSARDRFDEDYDMVRSVRDSRYLYVRNYYPTKPYVIWVPYRNKSNTMKEILRLHAEGELNEVQSLWLNDTRPPEELYDCTKDPFQVNNLSEDPKYHEKLVSMRNILNEWRKETGDMGDISEDQMVNNMWPNGEQPITRQPYFILNAKEDRASKLIEKDTVYLSAPAEIKIYSPSQGASIGFSGTGKDEDGWQFYKGPLHFNNDTIVTLHAKAIRYGYKESNVKNCTFVIQ